MYFKDTFFSYKPSINCGGSLLTFDRPLIMGIMNITPDSFYGGSRLGDTDRIREAAGRMLDDGASILDVGAVSTRPGAKEISEDQEMERLKPALETLRNSYPGAVISVDTTRSGVARKVVNEYQVDMINDISGGQTDQGMLETIAELKVPYVVMHMRGKPENMQEHTNYSNLLRELLKYFSERISILNTIGVNDIIIDPGFGFSKTVEQNFEILERLDAFHIFNLPVLVGLSRKSLIYKTLGISPAEALNGTTALHTVAVLKGASILRVHDVYEAAQVVKLLDNLNIS